MSAGPAAVRGRVRSAVLSCDSAGVCVPVTHKVGQIQTSRCFILNVRTICTSFHYVKHTYCTFYINAIVTPSLKKNVIGVLRIFEFHLKFVPFLLALTKPYIAWATNLGMPYPRETSPTLWI